MNIIMVEYNVESILTRDATQWIHARKF